MITAFADRIAWECSEPPAAGGDAVLLIHGLGGTSNTFTPLAAALHRHRCVAFDLPGSGRSARAEGPLSIERYLQAALRVMDEAGLERAHVVAHSMGTIVALHLAAQAPARVLSLTLFGPLFAPAEPARAAIRARGRKARDEGAAGMAAIADTLLATAVSASTRRSRPTAVAFVRESLMRQDADGYARSCDALAAAQPVEPSAIVCPVLLVTGDEDAVAPPQSVRAMGERLSAGRDVVRVEVLRGCGHWTPVEMPEACADLLARFLTRQPAHRAAATGVRLT
ncbi:MAG TPA: alpha/beta fold hydrolase [Burkholderiaceae bacterium]|nr:alpha/beta fold hydrolase [Burkholderiaceae bacterium]